VGRLPIESKRVAVYQFLIGGCDNGDNNGDEPAFRVFPWRILRYGLRGTVSTPRSCVSGSIRSGVLHNLPTTIQISKWAYSRAASTGGRTWKARNELVELSGSWASILS
jgi:hypothetical protein